MKIGDNVRFLNEIGGGRIVSFQGKDIVMVEDQDGFEVPVHVRECVVIESDPSDTDLIPQNTFAKSSKPTPASSQQTEPESKEPPTTFKPMPLERNGADALNLYLCFVPVEMNELSQTDFDVYLVNDSNYFIDFTWLVRENQNWKLHNRNIIEPNMKLWVETIERTSLNNLQHICFQLIAYKENKYFMLKEPLSINLNPDLTKFYKLHTFLSNPFFEERVLTYDLVRNDQAVRHTFFQAEEIKEAMTGGKPKMDDNYNAKLHAVAIRKPHSRKIEILDLHAEELLDTMRGMKPADILEYQLDIFRKKMEEIINQKGKQIVFIHGKGQGVLRLSLLKEISIKYKHCTCQDASFREYGYGATLVTVH